MRVIIQRCKNSSVEIEDKVKGEINFGYVILVGFGHDDEETIIDKMIDKIMNLRIFEDENQKMNLSLIDVKGSILSISQFTLYADTNNGRRPSFTNALEPQKASEYYDIFNQKLMNFGINVQTGIFGADMKVNIINDGPVTIYLDSKEALK
jgi:D-tyrosyl-tRNA(Tyr) deacylase